MALHTYAQQSPLAENEYRDIKRRKSRVYCQYFFFFVIAERFRHKKEKKQKQNKTVYLTQMSQNILELFKQHRCKMLTVN